MTGTVFGGRSLPGETGTSELPMPRAGRGIVVLCLSSNQFPEVDIVDLWQEVTLLKMPTKEFLSAEDDPILADLWDNDDDAIYDNL